MTPLLEARGLSKSFGAIPVTQGIDMDVSPGEVHAIIGPNGAGKTTLVNQLAGSLRPDAGRILFAGVDVTAKDMAGRARAGLSRSFQITSVLPRFSVLENVALAAQARAGSSLRFFAPASRERALNAAAEAALERVGLLPRAGVLAGALSHGEKRQLELAAALATAPKLLLLDEPLAGTSQDEAARIVGLLGTLRGEVAILLVEHDMDAVFALADRVSVLVEGRRIATGAPETIRADPAVRAAYLGDEDIPS